MSEKTTKYDAKNQPLKKQPDTQVKDVGQSGISSPAQFEAFKESAMGKQIRGMVASKDAKKREAELVSEALALEDKQRHFASEASKWLGKKEEKQHEAKEQRDAVVEKILEELREESIADAQHAAEMEPQNEPQAFLQPEYDADLDEAKQHENHCKQLESEARNEREEMEMLDKTISDLQRPTPSPSNNLSDEEAKALEAAYKAALDKAVASIETALNENDVAPSDKPSADTPPPQLKSGKALSQTQRSAVQLPEQGKPQMQKAINKRAEPGQAPSADQVAHRTVMHNPENDLNGMRSEGLKRFKPAIQSNITMLNKQEKTASSLGKSFSKVKQGYQALKKGAERKQKHKSASPDKQAKEKYRNIQQKGKNKALGRGSKPAYKKSVTPLSTKPSAK